MFFIDELATRRLIKLSAYDALMKFNVRSLPIDPLNLLYSRNDIVLYSYSFFQSLAGVTLEDVTISFGSYGAAIYKREYNKYFLYYNDTLSISFVRWTLARLLGAIELGSVDSISFFVMGGKDGGDCDTFAYYFTAPDVILKSAGISTPESIMQNCQIPFDKAYRKSKNLKFSIIERKTYIDKILRFNFDDYIETCKNTAPD